MQFLFQTRRVNLDRANNTAEVIEYVVHWFYIIFVLEYYFVTKDEMKSDIAAGKFLEYAEFGGNLYGTR